MDANPVVVLLMKMMMMTMRSIGNRDAGLTMLLVEKVREEKKKKLDG